MPHPKRHCVYCGRIPRAGPCIAPGEAKTCAEHAPLLLIDPVYALFWSALLPDAR